MRILYITNGFPYPLTSGYLRHYYFIKSLSRSHQVTLLSVTGRNFISEHANAMLPMVDSIYTFPSANINLTRRQKVIKRLQSFSTRSLRDDAVQKMRKTVHQLIEDKPYDLVFFSGRETYHAIEGIKGLPIIVDLCDAFMLRIRGRMRHTNPVFLPYFFLEYLIIRHVEQKLMREGTHILFASMRDLEAMRFTSSAPASVIPNGIDLDYWQRSTPMRQPNHILFTGGMDYAPNVDAAMFLLEQVFPSVRKSHPDAKVWIVGRDPAPRLVEAGKQEGVHVTGYVDDIRPYLEKATVFAAPLRFGAGIQNKVLEAMAMQVPVVSSPLAADGLRTEDGCIPPIQIANNPLEYSRLISAQLDAAKLDLSPVPANRRYVEEHFVWEKIGDKLNNIISSVSET